jgi:hypothetical protein
MAWIKTIDEVAAEGGLFLPSLLPNRSQKPSPAKSWTANAP